MRQYKRDMTLAAFCRNYDLSIYQPEVDREGFDLIIDDYDNIKHLQIKTVLSASSTKNWKLMKRLLRPSILDSENLGFEYNPTEIGLGGGLILIELEIFNTEVALKYYFIDLFILTAYRLGLTNRINKRITDTTYKIINKLKVGDHTEKVAVPKSVLVEAKGPEELLALIGVHSRFNTGWRPQIINISKEYYRKPEGSIPKSVITEFNNEFENLIN